MPIEIAYRIVDVFTDRPLAGNALCVVLDPVPEPVMQAIAREVNLSETTFPVVTGEADYEMRIFTPGGELPFAGHPSLGTAWALGARRWTQRTPGATVTVESDADGAVMTQPDPEFTPVDPERPGAALGLPGWDGAWVSEAGGTRHLFVLTDAPLEGLAPDLNAAAAVSRAERTTSVTAVRRLDDRLLHVRAFCPDVGIAEDPGTGSAAGPIGLLARQQWGTAADVVIRQGAEVGRPCVIDVHAEPGGITVGGRVAQCAKGHFTL